MSLESLITRSSARPVPVGRPRRTHTAFVRTGARPIAFLAAAAAHLLCALAVPPSLPAQEVGEASRLAGVASVALRASAVWDELITTSAGGATEAQFEEALRSGFEMAMSSADPGPTITGDEASFVLCHVDTFYDSGLIVYSVRVSHHRPGPDGLPVITWLKSWVGSYTAQQLHVIWTLADQCAAAFLEDWRTANP